MAHFIYNDINSNSLGIIVNILPERTIPVERKELITIPGKDGYLTYKEGAYEKIEKQIECTISKNANIDNIVKALKGTGKLILSNQPDRYYEAEIVNAIPFENILGLSKRFIIPFECKPFAKSITKTTKTLAVGTNNISVNGTGKTYPIIDIQGTGTFKITKGSTIINLKDIAGNIRIDNELMNATSIDELTNLNNKMDGNFISLENGTNAIVVEKVSGTLTSIKMEYQEAWL